MHGIFSDAEDDADVEVERTGEGATYNDIDGRNRHQLLDKKKILGKREETTVVSAADETVLPELTIQRVTMAVEEEAARRSRKKQPEFLYDGEWYFCVHVYACFCEFG